MFLDPDFGWHLYLGERMMESKRLITETVGYNFYNHLYLPDHEWLSDIVLYLSYHYVGYWFISLGFLALIVTTFLLLFSVLTKQEATKGSCHFVLLLFFGSLMPFYGIRLQVLLFLGVALVLFIRKSVPSLQKRMIFYFLLFAIGNNLHGGFLPIFLVSFFLELDAPKFRDLFSKKNLVIAGSMLILGAISFSLTPYGLNYWKLVFDYLGENYYKLHISEWRPLYAFPVQAGLILILATIFFFGTINKFFLRLPWQKKILLALFFYLGIRYLRFFPLFILIAAPTILESINDFSKDVLHREPQFKLYNIVIFLLIIASLYLGGPMPKFSAIKDPFENSSYPIKATEYLLKLDLTGKRLLNPYGWGGYLIWKLPDHEVFIDGRGPQVRLPNNKTILQQDLEFYSEDNKVIDAKLTEYDISIVLAQKDHNNLDFINSFLKKIMRLQYESDENNLTKFLASSSNWTLVYEDNISLVYIKK